MNSPIIYICDHIFSGEREVGLIAHHEDGMWQLTCGKPDHPTDEASLNPVHIEHVVTGNALADAMLHTPPGHLSELRDDGAWYTEAFSEENE